MSSAEELLAKHYRPEDHPYRHYERKIDSFLRPEHTILDVGCGRSAPVLSKYIGRAGKLIGVDLEDESDTPDEIHYIQGSISSINVPDESVDIAVSRAVMEHIEDPVAAFSEINRVLKPGGAFIFLTPNLWDYVSLISYVVPNRFHPIIVNKTEGRTLEDVFPAYYRCNTYRAVSKLCVDSGLIIRDFDWLSQYPAGFMFSTTLFRLGMLYDRLISRFESLAFLRGWILVALEKPATPQVQENVAER